MSAISQKSISGITSITTPAGVDNVFTVHTNDTTERFRVDSNGNQVIAGILTASNHVFLTSGDLVINDVISHFGDGNTKIRFPADDNISFETAGSERLRISSSGKVGIGTDNPLQKLHIADNTSANIYLETKNSTTGVTAGLYYKTSSSTASDFFKTGIVLEDDGTSHARGKLHILQNNTADGSNATLSDSVVTFTQDGKVGIGTDNPSQALDVNGKIKVFGSDGSPYGLFIDPDSSGGTYETLIGKANGDLRLQAGAATYQATAANILLRNTSKNIIINAGNDGKVGIGTDAVDTLLHLQGDKPKLRIESTNVLEASAGTEEIGRIEFEAKKGSNINVAASLRVRQDGTWSTVDDWFSPTAIEFYTQDQSGTEITTPRLTINNAGKVGIGTAIPTYILQTFNAGAVGSAENSRKYNGRFTTYTGNRLNLDIYDRRWEDTQTHGWVGTEKRIEYNVDDHTNKRMWMSFFNPSSTTANNVIRFGEREDTEWMRIYDGKVGIGTDNPAEDLHIGSNSPYILLDDYDNARKWKLKGTAWFAIEDTTAGVDRLRILSDGKVGIGTDNPGTLLHLSSNAPAIRLTDTDTAGPLHVDIESASGDLYLDTASVHRDVIITSVGKTNEVARFTGDGKVGIGSNDPGALLSISGNDSRLRLTKSNAAANLRHWDLAAQGEILRLQAKSEVSSGGGNLFDFYRSTNQINEFRGMRGGSYWFVINNDTARVGIGTAIPQDELHIEDTTPAIRLTDSANGQYAFIDGNSGNLVLHSDKGNSGGSSTVKFGVDNSVKMTLDSNGHLDLATGNLQFANGSGIDFSNVPATSGNTVTSDGNKFDDYEEGTYNPTRTPGNGNITATTSNTLRYVKVGRLVHLVGRLHFNTNQNDLSSFTISLPFANTTGNQHDTSVCTHIIRGNGGDPVQGIRIFRIGPGGTVMYMNNHEGQGYGNLGTTSPHININFSYFAA